MNTIFIDMFHIQFKLKLFLANFHSIQNWEFSNPINLNDMQLCVASNLIKLRMQFKSKKKKENCTSDRRHFYDISSLISCSFVLFSYLFFYLSFHSQFELFFDFCWEICVSRFSNFFRWVDKFIQRIKLAVISYNSMHLTQFA